LFAALAAAGAERPAAPWPPPPGTLRVIIDADAANEVDDQYAIALALGSPARLKIEGFVAAHFGLAGGARGIERSFAEIETTLDRAGLSGRFPIKRGADPIVYRDRPPESEGVDFIVERARAATPADPLWLVLLGPATDAAAALLKAPDIADRLIVFWHGRTQWPLRCWNFNAHNDIKAAQLLFSLPCRFILFDTGTYLTLPPEEGERRFSPLGALGRYLHEIRTRKPGHLSPTKGFFDLGDIAALVDHRSVRFERTAAPAVDHDLRYDFSRRQGEIVRIYHVERDHAFDLLEKALARLAQKPPA
jgi:inosine-uridine nucleoside N-ribohydrolase